MKNKFKAQTLTGKVMAGVFWDREEVVFGGIIRQRCRKTIQGDMWRHLRR